MLDLSASGVPSCRVQILVMSAVLGFLRVTWLPSFLVSQGCGQYEEGRPAKGLAHPVHIHSDAFLA